MEKEYVRTETGNYLIEHEMNVGGKRLFLAYCEKSKLPFMVGEKEVRDIVVKYDHITLTDDYLSALSDWHSRVGRQIKNLKAYRSALPDTVVIRKDDVFPVSPDMSILNKVVAIRADVFLHETRFSSNQLYFVDGGFGAQADARGQSIFCESIFDGKKVRFKRQDVLGVLRGDRIPEWARERIGELQASCDKSILADVKPIRKVK